MKQRATYIAIGAFLAALVLFYIPQKAHAGIFDLDFETFFNSMLESIAYMWLWVMAKFVWLAGVLLNISVVQSLHITELVNNATGVELAWKVIRDFTSMFFIFVLLYAAITHILGLTSGATKKVIINIVIAGLLINFSMFFTKLIIDGSNIVAMGFYQAIIKNQSPPTNNSTSTWSQFTTNMSGSDGGLSNIFMTSMKLTSIYDAKGVQARLDGKSGAAGTGLTWYNILLVGIMGSILMLVAAFVFFAASLMFIIRIAILVILIAISPVAFMGMILPSTQKYSSQWWNTLIDQAIFAPAYLAMTYLAVLILTSDGFMSFGSNGSSFSGAIIGGQSPVIFINFIIVIIFFLAALVIARSFGGKAGALGLKYADIGKKFAGGLGGYAGRNIIGKPAEKINKWAENTTAFGGKIATLANTKIGRGVRDATLGTATKAKFGSEMSREDATKQRDAREKEIKAKQGQIDSGVATDRAIKAGTQAGASVTDREKIGLELAKLTPAQIEKLGIDRLSNPEVARHLSEGQLEHVMKSSDVSDSDKEKIVSARFVNTQTALNSGNRDQIKTAVKSITEKDIDHLGIERLSQVAEHMSGKQIAAVQKSKSYTESQKQKIKEAKLAPLKTLVDNGDEDGVGAILKKMSAEDVAKLPTELLTKDAVMENLTTSHLMKIQEEGLSDDTVKKISRYIEGKIDHPAKDYVTTGAGKDYWKS